MKTITSIEELKAVLKENGFTQVSVLLNGVTSTKDFFLSKSGKINEETSCFDIIRYTDKSFVKAYGLYLETGRFIANL